MQTFSARRKTLIILLLAASVSPGLCAEAARPTLHRGPFAILGDAFAAA
jgi:hypothetical protein